MRTKITTKTGNKNAYLIRDSGLFELCDIYKLDLTTDQVINANPLINNPKEEEKRGHYYLIRFKEDRIKKIKEQYNSCFFESCFGEVSLLENTSDWDYYLSDLLGNISVSNCLSKSKNLKNQIWFIDNNSDIFDESKE